MIPHPTYLLSGWAHPPARLTDLRDRLTLRMPTPEFFDWAEQRVSDEAVSGIHSDAPSPYATSLYGDCLVAHPPALLIGWSAGALIALEAAIHWPDHVHALVLIGATSSFCARDAYSAGFPPSRVRAMRKRLGSAREPRMLTGFYAACADNGNSQAANHEQADESTSPLPTSTDLATGLLYLEHIDLRDRIMDVRKPVLLLHGANDRIVPLAAAQWLHEHLFDAELSVYDDVGHHLPLRSSERAAEDILAFVERRA